MARRREGHDDALASKQPAKKNGNGANLGFEAWLFLAADKPRRNLEPSDYKHVALGLIFLQYISDAFETNHAGFLAEDPEASEDPTKCLAENFFWACWSRSPANSTLPITRTLS